MKKIILLSLLYVLLGKTFAQNCNEAALLSTPRKWILHSRTAKKLPAELKVVTAIHNFILPKYSPKGADALYSFTLADKMNLDVKNHAYQYLYSIYFADYYCEDNSMQVRKPPYPANVIVFANHPGVLFTRNAIGTVTLEEKQRDHYGWLTQMPVFKNGVWFLSESTENTQWDPETKAEWLITYDGKLPFEYVTRKEYLLKVKEKLAIQFEQNIASAKDNSTIRPKTEQEKEKNEMVEMFVKGSARANKYLAEYKTDEEKLEEIIKKYKEIYAGAMKIADKYLRQPKAELKKTAIITLLTTGDFSGFAQENDQYALIVVKDNPAYFNPKLSKEVPQSFYIRWLITGINKIPVLKQAYTDVMKTFDFAALKNLLRK
jgi:hypothetical protein